MTRGFRYLVLDVFTAEPLRGNPLAVFPDATGLTGEQMQAVARAFNLSETAFCLPTPDEAATREHGTRVRIFTTQEELPFAGHPTLGTATALRLVDGAWQGRDEVRLLLSVGTVPVRFSTAGAGPGGSIPFGVPVQGVMEQKLPVFGRVHDASVVMPLLGLPQNGLGEALDAGKPIQTVSTGSAFVIVVLRTVEALSHLRLDTQKAEEYLREERSHGGGRFFYVLAPESADGTRWRARMQFYGGEDPATGSAAGCAAAYLVHHGFAPAGTPLHIAQGVEIGRPGEIEVSAQLAGAPGVPTNVAPAVGARYVRVGGSTVPVAEGRFFLR